MPPAVAVVCGVIEVLLASEQGVKYHCVAYPVNSSVIQDIAACRVMREFCDRYAKAAGYDDIEIAYAIHQWLGPFPEDKSRALARIAFDSATAVYAGVDKILVKSSEEGQGTPTNQGNIEGLRATRQGVDLAQGQAFPECAELDEECDADPQARAARSWTPCSNSARATSRSASAARSSRASTSFPTR